jgi:hypothetical protein
MGAAPAQFWVGAMLFGLVREAGVSWWPQMGCLEPVEAVGHWTEGEELWRSAGLVPELSEAAAVAEVVSAAGTHYSCCTALTPACLRASKVQRAQSPVRFPSLACCTFSASIEMCLIMLLRRGITVKIELPFYLTVNCGSRVARFTLVQPFFMRQRRGSTCSSAIVRPRYSHTGCKWTTLRVKTGMRCCSKRLVWCETLVGDSGN